MIAGFLPDSLTDSAPDLILLSAVAVAVATLGRYTARVVRTLFAFFHRIDKALDNVEKQLYPNGGASLRDAVNRIQDHLGIENVDADAHTHNRRKDDDPDDS